MRKLATVALCALALPSVALADDKEELTCLAHNIYFEARGEGVNEQVAVAHVTLNRVDSTEYPDNVCDVVWQPWQFSWTMDESLHHIDDDKAWTRAVTIAMYVYGDVIDYDETYGATHYWAHDKISRPYWGRNPDQEIKLAAHTYIIPN